MLVSLFSNYKTVWEEDDISIFISMWRDGKSIDEIAEGLNVNKMDIKLLACDQLNVGKIKPRGEKVIE